MCNSCSLIQVAWRYTIFNLTLAFLGMHERVTVVTLSVSLSVCQSVCHFSMLEKAPFLGLYILGDDLSPLNVALF